MRTKKSPKRANIARINFVAVRPLLALASDKVEREDGLSKLYLPPQVPVASLPSPAVMDIRPLRGRFVVTNVQNMNVLKRCVFFSF